MHEDGNWDFDIISTQVGHVRQKKKKTSTLKISLDIYILFIGRYIVTWSIYHLILVQNENRKKKSTNHLVLIPKSVYWPIYR